MDPTELGDLLMRNRRDMEMATGGSGGGATGTGSGGIGNSLPRKMIQLVTALVIMGCKSASANPRSATLITLAFLSMIYILYSAPRNGILISGKRGILSSGMTTILPPPTQYLSDFTLSDRFGRLQGSMAGNGKSGALSKVFENENQEEGVHVASLSTKEKKKISLALTARKTVPFEVLLPSEEELELLFEKEKESKDYTKDIENEELMQLVEERAWEESIELAFNSAESIIAARRFTEFIASPSSRVKFVARGTGSKKDKAVLVMKSMGDWRRYGIQPLMVASEEKSTNVSSVIYYTLQGGHFDGELNISVRKDVDASQSDPSITVIVTLLIGKGGRKVNARLASKMVALLADSIATSTLTAARQTLSRKLQSTIYRGKAKSRAMEKRHIAFDNMQKMEEMAEDRRRKWQRNNKGTGGSYRPTGCRPPDGGPRFGC